MNIAIVTEEGKILLPDKMIAKLTPFQKFAVIEDGDKIILNPIRIPDADEIAKRKKVSPPSMDEISEEVHKYREERRK